MTKGRLSNGGSRAPDLEFLRRLRVAVRGPSLGLALLGLSCGGHPGLVTDKPDGAATAALCGVSTTQRPPFDVQFVFHGTGSGLAYLRESCGGFDFGVSSCASGYSRKLGPVSGLGTCACGVVPCSPPVGGACASPAAVALSAAGAPVNAAWRATSVELEWTGTTQCTRTAMLPAGKYRVAIRAYETPEDAERGVRGWVVTRDFDLPAPGGVVDVPIGARAAEPCETATADAVPTCTGREAREAACNLPGVTTFLWAGGELALYYDTFKVAPPASFSISRLQNGSDVPMPLPCATAVPRCSADARVVTTSDLTRVLAEPSIAAAFTSPRTFFGSRPAPSIFLEVQRPDGTAIGIGGACLPPEPNCARAITPAAFAVEEAFRLVELQRTADGCVDYYRY